MKFWLFISGIFSSCFSSWTVKLQEQWLHRGWHLLQHHILTRCCKCLVLYEPKGPPNSTSISTKLIRKNSNGFSTKAGKASGSPGSLSAAGVTERSSPHHGGTGVWKGLQIPLLEHSPKNFTGMRKTLAGACSNYVQNHKYEKYSQLAFPRQIVNKHSFLTWGSMLAVGRLAVGCLTYFSICTTKIFPLSLHTGSLKKKFKYLNLVFNPSTISLLGKGSLIINVHEGE